MVSADGVQVRVSYRERSHTSENSNGYRVSANDTTYTYQSTAPVPVIDPVKARALQVANLVRIRVSE